jgi:hypothetical protein
MTRRLLIRVWDWAGQAVEPVDARDRPSRCRSMPSTGRWHSALDHRRRGSGGWWPAAGLSAPRSGLVGGRRAPRDVATRYPRATTSATVRPGAAQESSSSTSGRRGAPRAVRPGHGKHGDVRSVAGRSVFSGRRQIIQGGRRRLGRSSLRVMNADGSGARGTVGRWRTSVGADGAGSSSRASWLYVIDVASGTSVRRPRDRHRIHRSDPTTNRPPCSGTCVGSREAYSSADGTGLRPLGVRWPGDWSPDGSTIVYNVPPGQPRRTASTVRPSRHVDSQVDRELTFDGHPGCTGSAGCRRMNRLLVWRRTGTFGGSGSCSAILRVLPSDPRTGCRRRFGSGSDRSM